MRRPVILLSALLLASPAVAAEDPAGFAVRLPVRMVAGASLQRLTVPVRALAASRRAGLADVRIFDATGRAVPIAFATAAPVVRRQAVPLRPMPILGAADALAVTGVSLRIDDSRQARIVRVEGMPQPVGGAVTLGVLIDTRRLEGAVTGLTLDADRPREQPVTFVIETSADLKDWQPLAEQVLYRTAEGAGPETIAFGAQDLRGRYVRITWRAASRLISPVTVRGVSAIVARGPAGPAPQRAVLALPAPSGPHAIQFTLPFATPVSALEIAAGAGDQVVPVRILGRNDAEQPWAPIASGSVYRLTAGGASRANPPFDLAGAQYRTIRIEADDRTPGFTVPPRIAVRFDPVRLLFLAAGPPPFTLAAGRADAAAVALPPESLVPGYGPAADAALPVATVADEPDPVIAVSADGAEAPSWRKAALWAALLAGTLLLAAMVWLLARRRAPPPPADTPA